MARERYNAAIGNGEPVVVQYEKKSSTTFLIVLVSLVFVAIFGGALVGGVVSGDPSNGFFMIIIVASSIAIGVAAIVTLMHYCKHRDDDATEYHKDEYHKDLRATATRSQEEENQYGEDEEYYDHDHQDRHAVDRNIKEVRAKSVAGDVSAFTPQSYDVESYSTHPDGAESRASRSYGGYGQRVGRNQRREQRGKKGLFDFASVGSASRRSARPQREDPPEESGSSSQQLQMQRSKDPSASKITFDGQFLEEESDDDVGLNSPSVQSQESRTSRYDTVHDGIDSDVQTAHTAEVHTEVVETKSRGRGRSRSKSPGRNRSKSPARGRSESPPPPARRRSNSPSKEKKFSTQDTIVPPPPPSVRNEKSNPASKKSTTIPSTPAPSEVGSSASSTFFKPFSGLFGKKRPASEAGNSEASSYVKGEGSDSRMSGYNTNLENKNSESKSNASASMSEGKPPTKPPRSGRRGSNEAPAKSRPSSTRGNGLDTIGGSSDRYAPSASGKSSTFSIPPPRRVPSTPAGSEAPSEFRSVAESSFSNGVASSTFSPQLNERARIKSQRNNASLGANPVSDMPVYYEEEEEEESVAQTGGYDVLAPPGPIGIVVDTTKKGCIVHSLKKTSPMQGLIIPGDFILALDDVDVRKMDAASLTRLMAKKSQQKERKFTLISAELY